VARLSTPLHPLRLGEVRRGEGEHRETDTRRTEPRREWEEHTVQTEAFQVMCRV
jgi:hypothetical protein